MIKNSSWSHIPEHINPVFFSLGPFQIHWYGLMYVIAFSIFYGLAIYRIRTEEPAYSKKMVLDFLTWAIAGVLLGGRLGYVLFYDFGYFAAHPVRIISPFDFSNGFQYTGIYGMSYHGGMIGVMTAAIFFCRKNKIKLWPFVDFVIPAIPLGYLFGRLGNFINGELYGRVTVMPWGMYFPLDPLHQLRHPSQLYEVFFEGLILFLVLWNLRTIKFFNGFLFCLYLIGYGLMRFFIEFVREPDSQLGFVAGPFTMGQILCFMMILAGGSILTFKLARQIKS